MTNKELIKELIEKEMKKIEAEDFARPCDKRGFDKYDSQEIKGAHIEEYARYRKLKDVLKYLTHDNIESDISQHIPDWKEIIQNLIEQELKRLKDEDLARSNAYTGIDKYDSQEELDARKEGLERYSKLVKINQRLNNDQKAESKKRAPFSWLKKQPKESFFEDR